MDGLILLAVIVLAAAVLGAVFFGRRRQQSKSEEAGAARLFAAIERLAELQSEQSGRLSQTQSGINERLEALASRLGDGLAEQTGKTGESLKALYERLAVIDAAQNNIASLSKQMASLQDILSNKQNRGAFGEFKLNDLIKDALPPKAFSIQHTLSSRVRVDCLVKLPNPPGAISIDSKFPLESYRNLQAAANEAEKKQARQDFKASLLMHIKDIQEKYIIPGETADWAIMFIPSETVYAEAHANFPGVIEEAHKRRIAIVSPTTLMATLITVRAILRDAEMKEQAGLIQAEVKKMLNDVRLLEERASTLGKRFEALGSGLDDIIKSAKRIARGGEKILEVELTGSQQPSQLAAQGEQQDGLLESAPPEEAGS